MIARKKLIFLSITLLLGGVSACQNKNIVDKNPPFSINTIRLSDAEVAEVDGTTIYFSDVEAQARTNGTIKKDENLSTDDPTFRATLEELIDRRVLALEAMRQSLDQRDSTQHRIASMREQILASTLIEDMLARKVTDKTAHRLYEEQAALRSNSKQIRARMITVATREAADAIIERLNQGEDFASLAKEYSTDTSTGDIGGDMGYFSQNAVKPALGELAFSLKDNEVSKPTQIDEQWVIMKTMAHRATPQPKYEDISKEIESFMTYDEIAKLVKSLRTRSDIKLIQNAPKTEKTDLDKNNENP